MDLPPTADRRRTIESTSGAALNLNALRTCKQIREIDPVHIVIFGVVLRDAIDHDRQPSLVKAPQIDIVVADTVAVFRIIGNRWKVRKQYGHILHGVTLLQIDSRKIGERHRRKPFEGLSSCDNHRR